MRPTCPRARLEGTCRCGTRSSPRTPASPGLANCQATTAVIVSQGGSVSDGGDCPLTAAGDLPNTDPGLTAFGDHGGQTETFDLLPGSPAIGRGAACPGVDQRDLARNEAVCDSGAVEHRAKVKT